MNISDYTIVIYEDNPVWEKTLTLWCSHYGFNKVQSFSDEGKFQNFMRDSHMNVDICLIDFYDNIGNTTPLIRFLRELSDEMLIISISADFVSDEKVLDTEEMVKALWAGANRVTYKDIKYVKEILNEHLAVRSRSDYAEIKTDPSLFYKKL